MRMTREKEMIAAIGEPVRGLGEFLQLLEEMDEKSEAKKRVCGEVLGPFSSRAVYSCVVKIGLER